LLKQCALAFAQSKPTEWDHFRQEWFAQKKLVVVFPTNEVCFRSPLHSDISGTATAEELKEENIMNLPEEEVKRCRSRALKKDEE